VECLRDVLFLLPGNSGGCLAACEILAMTGRRNDRPRPLSCRPRLDQDDHLGHGALLQNCANGFEVVLEREG
jgi:hypothetical protein